MPDYAIPRNLRFFLRKRDALLQRLGKIGPLINGSLVLIARTCGNSDRCHCSRGRKHVSTYLTYGVKGKTHTLYIPVGLEREARQWSAEYRRAKGLIRAICDLQKEIVRRHVQEKARQKR